VLINLQKLQNTENCFIPTVEKREFRSPDGAHCVSMIRIFLLLLWEDIFISDT
jgi:hypothetical protein